MDPLAREQIEQASPFSIHRQRRVLRPDDGVIYRGGYWNHGQRGIAIVAAVNPGHDWAAYIGHGEEHGESEDETLIYVAEHGIKLDEATARFMFPDIRELWRR